MSEDKIKLQGIMSEGYGLIPKKVMKDKTLTIEAKVIYAFTESHSNDVDTSYLSVEYIADYLNISIQCLDKHMEILEEKGYINVCKESSEK